LSWTEWNDGWDSADGGSRSTTGARWVRLFSWSSEGVVAVPLLTCFKIDAKLNEGRFQVRLGPAGIMTFFVRNGRATKMMNGRSSEAAAGATVGVWVGASAKLPGQKRSRVGRSRRADHILKAAVCASPEPGTTFPIDERPVRHRCRFHSKLAKRRSPAMVTR
jgi:hypothetical protein